MKVLALSDQVVPLIYSPAVRERYSDVRLIVGCGDLPAEYLEYVVTQLNVPLVYVPGNHDPDEYIVHGGGNIDGRWTKVAGISVAGLGGSRRYKPAGGHQYTETEMFYRTARMLLTIRTGGRGVRLMVTHASPAGVHDVIDGVHDGFRSFHTLVRIGRPDYLLHGHTHAVRNLVPTETRLFDTCVVNVYPFRLIDVPEAA